MALEIPHYFPQFLWKFWLSDIGQTSHVLRDPRVHIYDVYENELTETRRIPEQKRTVFQDFNTGDLDVGCRDLLATAEWMFTLLENEAEATLTDLMRKASPNGDNGKTLIPVDRLTINNLCKFLVFLRFPNSTTYGDIIATLRESLPVPDFDNGGAFPSYRFIPVRRRVILGGFIAFLQHSLGNTTMNSRSVQLQSSPNPDPYQEALNQYCWRFCKADVCIGIATEEEEFMITDSCFGTLDEGFDEDPGCCDLFFPIIPTLALYILANPDKKIDHSVPKTRTNRATMWIECGVESPSDVHLRNAMLLQTYPRHLYFSSLRSVAQSISSYDEFRWIPEHLDYSRLKLRCRQKYTIEKVTKTLVVKGSVIITDLTDEVVRIGQSAVCHGSFSDIWKGVWNDPAASKPRVVALKFLRQVMVQNVREKLLKRLKDEVIAWHRLQHDNVARLHGIIQSSNTIAMVSPWCENGTITHYLKEKNPTANRVELLTQVASGVSYLHNFKPVVVHGDLKGGNILVDDRGRAILTDFGLSKVIEEMTDAINLGTSFFAGSTRWMAPELVLALVEDDGRAPPITTHSDVYAFASVCLEIVTDQLPYPHRTNDHAVTVDIMRGVKPSRGASRYICAKDEEPFWAMLERCWEHAWYLRPSMSEVTAFLENMNTS